MFFSPVLGGLVSSAPFALGGEAAEAMESDVALLVACPTVNGVIEGICPSAALQSGKSETSWTDSTFSSLQTMCCSSRTHTRANNNKGVSGKKAVETKERGGPCANLSGRDCIGSAAPPEGSNVCNLGSIAEFVDFICAAKSVLVTL